ncbi:MAG: NADH-quinone oxidoreductase subunit J [Gammaproteobacteria bacterium]|jgi:NADH-quinone oxidoreductase subunit J|nr:NADH-quinone oxidoreductase subunit J [Gammaproteobacteria bacterium]
MNAWPFYAIALITIFTTIRTVTNTNPVHALLNLIISLLSIAGLFFCLGAPFAAALEVIVYAGAILVLFVFVVMMLNLGKATVAQEKRWFSAETWAWPSGLAFLLGLAIVWLLGSGEYSAQAAVAGTQTVDAKVVGIALFGPYLLLVELASLLLLAALVAAYHLGRNTDGFNDPIEIRNLAAETAEKIKLSQAAHEAEKIAQQQSQKGASK